MANVQSAAEEAVSCYIDRLPFELLSKIFVMCTAESSLQKSTSMRDHLDHTSTVVISSVSRRWRCIAVATGRLWTNIRIVGQNTLHSARTWITRTGSYELHVECALSEWDLVVDAVDALKPSFDTIVALNIDMLRDDNYVHGCQDCLKFSLFPQLSLGPNRLRRLQFQNAKFPSASALRAFLATCKALKHLDISSCSSRESWMSGIESLGSRLEWFAMDELVELALPVAPLAERIRRYLIAPHLARVSLFFDCQQKPASNTLLINESSDGDKPKGCHRIDELLLLVPEVEELTFIFAAKSSCLDENWLFSHLTDTFLDYPLPTASFVSDEDWWPQPATVLPRLHTLRLLNVPTRLDIRNLLIDDIPIPLAHEGLSVDDVATSHAAFVLIVFHDGKTVRLPRPLSALRNVEVVGYRKPSKWSQGVAALEATGIKVTGTFGGQPLTGPHWC
ncbi:hypothetical protein CALCODRAFT_496994 [Calocera cornea HHB12733]|uniref:F-box domain-containing protein n=1 Tax=Calocera cornea HHB12733 TaxID=1353952 RepID=A0A165FJ26_9BASI|nr:hypothetical protein CALCODRAFT_496994 [Calocera cornea HHB12733]